MARSLRRGLGQTFARYRALVENAVEGIFQTTPEGRYVMANPMLARIYGYDTPEELIRTLTDIAHQLYVDPNRREDFRQLLDERDSVQDFESRVYRRDGQIIWIRESARAVRTADGRLLGFEGTVEDITARKQAETERTNALIELSRAREQLERRVLERTAELAAANSALRAEITERRRAEDELAAAHHELAAAEAEKKRFYREVIRCVTSGKFHLVDAAEIPPPGEALLEHRLAEPRDEPTMRRALRALAADVGMTDKDGEDLELAAGEAATNAIKHAGGGGCTVYRQNGGLAVRIADAGAGIRADDLPATILLPGFSNAVSLGMGYTLMLALVDRIWLATDRDGTIVQLEKRIGSASAPPCEKILPQLSAWDRL